MKISGTAALNAPVDQAWAAFNDPAVPARPPPALQGLRAGGRASSPLTTTPRSAGPPPRAVAPCVAGGPGPWQPAGGGPLPSWKGAPRRALARFAHG